jgi:hypothetical protein
MSPIDQQLYEMFPTEDITLIDQFNWVTQLSFRIEPQLHDVFRVWEDREIKLWIHNTSEYLYSLHVRTNDRVYYLCSYNPTKSLSEQSYSTKQSLIDLFS